ncbi:MAG: response regulator [Candidatus Omnitrophica bacterium]|nr:response regulator [Candidatus Omnitrophota bacterium]
MAIEYEIVIKKAAAGNSLQVKDGAPEAADGGAGGMPTGEKFRAGDHPGQVKSEEDMRLHPSSALGSSERVEINDSSELPGEEWDGGTADVPEDIRNIISRLNDAILKGDEAAFSRLMKEYAGQIERYKEAWEFAVNIDRKNAADVSSETIIIIQPVRFADDEEHPVSLDVARWRVSIVEAERPARREDNVIFLPPVTLPSRDWLKKLIDLLNNVRKDDEEDGAAAPATSRDGGTTAIQKTLYKIRTAIRKNDDKALELHHAELIQQMRQRFMDAIATIGVAIEFKEEMETTGGLEYLKGNGLAWVYDGFMKKITIDTAIQSVVAGDSVAQLFRVGIGKSPVLVMHPTVQGLKARYRKDTAKQGGGKTSARETLRLKFLKVTNQIQDDPGIDVEAMRALLAGLIDSSLRAGVIDQANAASLKKDVDSGRITMVKELQKFVFSRGGGTAAVKAYAAGKTVLVAEDVEPARIAAVALYEGLGFKVRVVTSASELFSEWQESSEPFDLVSIGTTTGINTFSTYDGLAAAGNIHEHHPKVPILWLEDSYSNKEGAAAAFERGVITKILQKARQDTELMQALEELAEAETGRDGGKIKSEEKTASKKVAGIDFRALPVATEPAAAVQPMMQGAAAGIPLAELDKKWTGIQKKMAEGPMPYKEIKEYVQSCCQRQDAARQFEEVQACIASILSMEEAAAVQTSPELKEILSALG